MQDLRLGHRIVYDVKANWKLIIQNYNECLHCPNLHPALNKLSHYLSGENEPLHADLHGRPDGPAAGRGDAVDGRHLPARVPAGALSRGPSARVYYYAIFPNMLLSLHPDYMMTHTLWPHRAGPDDQRLRVALPPDRAARAGLRSRPTAIEFWDMTNRQDWHVCELSQAGISSRAYVPGPYSNREDLLYAFDRMIVRFHGV